MKFKLFFGVNMINGDFLGMWIWPFFIDASRNICIKDIGSWAAMVFENYQKIGRDRTRTKWSQK